MLSPRRARLTLPNKEVERSYTRRASEHCELTGDLLPMRLAQYQFVARKRTVPDRQRAMHCSGMRRIHVRFLRNVNGSLAASRLKEDCHPPGERKRPFWQAGEPRESKCPRCHRIIPIMLQNVLFSHPASSFKFTTFSVSTRLNFITFYMFR